MKKPESKHFRLDISDANISLLVDPDAWLEKLDRAYEAYADLVGATPYNGKKITILESTLWNQYWAVAGNPIHWSPGGIPKECARTNAGSWSFGLLHEIGHDFDDVYVNSGPCPWVWNGEPTANFKMAYVIEVLPDVVVFSGEEEKRFGSFPTGYPRAKEIYRGVARLMGDEHKINIDFRKKGALEELLDRRGDSITFHLIELKDNIGWQPFRMAFRELRTMPRLIVPLTQLGRLKLFIETVNKHADHEFDALDFLRERGFPF